MREVRMEDFVERMKEKHPGLEISVLKKIINQGCHNIEQQLKSSRDIVIESGRKKVKFQIYKYRDYWKEKEKNAKKI